MDWNLSVTPRCYRIECTPRSSKRGHVTRERPKFGFVFGAEKHCFFVVSVSSVFSQNWNLIIVFFRFWPKTRCSPENYYRNFRLLNSTRSSLYRLKSARKLRGSLQRTSVSALEWARCRQGRLHHINDGANAPWKKTENRALRNTTRRNMLRREVFITFHTERTQWTSLRQSREFQTKMKGGCMIRMFCQWCLKRQKLQGGKDMTTRPYTTWPDPRSRPRSRSWRSESCDDGLFQSISFTGMHVIKRQDRFLIFILFRFLPARRYASAVIAIATCPSVCPSVRPSVTSRYCVKTKKASVMISSPSGSPTILVFSC